MRAGETRHRVKLALAKVAETVHVGRDARERASDPRSDAFATVLGETEIKELPDDPDEMEQALKDMAGPGAVMRVNGFRGGRLPPKDQIARSGSTGTCSPPTRTSPGSSRSTSSPSRASTAGAEPPTSASAIRF